MLPGGWLSDECSHRKSNEISATAFIFLNYMKPACKSGLQSQGGTVSSFVFFFTSYLPRCALYVLLMYFPRNFNHYVKGKDGLHYC